MRRLLLTAATAAALASALMAAQAQEAGAPPSQSNTVEPRSVKTETIRRTDPSGQTSGQTNGQASGQAATGSQGNNTATADKQTAKPSSTARRTTRVQRHRVATRHHVRPVQQRASRVRTSSIVTTGPATRRVSNEPLPVGARPRYAEATVVERVAVAPDRIVLTEPQVTQLNAAFTDYIVRMNVWSRPVWDVPATVGGTVPGWIQVYGMPAEIVALYPDFSGDQFLVVGDDIVVLDPVSRQIVAMISRTANTAVALYTPSTTAVAAPVEERVRLTRAQIATIRTVLRDRTCRYERPAGFFIGGVVPSTAPFCAFPERVVTVVPDIADYRYITRRGEVVVVDPADYRVVTVLR